MYSKKKNAIALLITMFFIMLISVAVGLNLQNVKRAKKNASNEKFMIQSTIIVNDILKILQNNTELDNIKDANTFRTFLDKYNVTIPLEKNFTVVINLQSARRKLDINAIKSKHSMETALIEYCNAHMINSQYVYILEDLMKGAKKDGSYYSGLFAQRPYLFRNYVDSDEQIKELNEYYKETYHDNGIDKIDLHKNFYFTDINSSLYILDLNFVTKDVYNIMNGNYTEAKDVNNQDFFVDCKRLTKSEKDNYMKKFNASCILQKFIDVTLFIRSESHNSTIEFEYDVNKKKASNYVYEI